MVIGEAVHAAPCALAGDSTGRHYERSRKEYQDESRIPGQRDAWGVIYTCGIRRVVEFYFLKSSG
ncbi:MAG: hypothetical protein ABSD38_36070 [Syntrophorhabdales bacterium]|jgi:hypothetical protein